MFVKISAEMCPLIKRLVLLLLGGLFMGCGALVAGR
jgi:hypothetical protein